MTSIDSALKLADLGFAVFPCAPNQKRPATQNGLLDASADPETVEAMFRAAPNGCNLAIRTDGLLVVDVDGASNPWLTDQPERLSELADAPISLTPRGGKHFIFRQPDGRRFRNTASKLADKVDTRGDGGYILVPPSAVDGKPYKWGTPIDCEPDKLPLPPAWLIELLTTIATPATRSIEPITGDGIPDGQRNATLTSLGGTMRRRGMSEEAIAAALKIENLARCKPPLDPAEVEIVAKSVARYAPDQIESIMAGGMADIDLADDNRPVDPGAAIPPKLLRPPGFISSVVDFTLATAPHPEPVLALAGALSLQAFLASRKVSDPSDNRSSLYIVALAHSGVGKDYPRQVCKRVLQECGLGDCVADSVASGEGLEDALFLQPSFLLLADEVDFLFSAIKSKRDPRFEGIAKTLLQLYTSAASVYSLRIKAGKKDRDTVDQPALTMCGTAVPGRLYEALSPAVLTNGLFGRLLIFEAGKRHPGQDTRKTALPDSILATAKYWADFVPGSERNLAAIHPTPLVVNHTSAAQEILRDFRDEAGRRIGKAEAIGDECTMSIFNRANEKARRLALNYACSADYQNPIIGADAATWACDLVRYLTDRMLFMADANVSENEFDAKCQKAVRVIRKWMEANPAGWMPGWLLKRRIKGWTPDDHDRVRRILLDSGTIERELISPANGGWVGEAFRVRQPAAAK